MKILIIGAGGHGQVVADILISARLAGDTIVQPVGYLDDDPTVHCQELMGLPVFGPIVQVSTIPHDGVIVAVGDNVTRQAIYQQLNKMNEQFGQAIHPAAIIGSEVTIGVGTMICAGVVVNPGARIGTNVILNTSCSVDHHNHIGDHAHIGPGVHLGGDVDVGEGTLIGIGATVMPQRRLGDWSVAGAGALVTKDVPSRSTVVGLPARPVK